MAASKKNNTKSSSTPKKKEKGKGFFKSLMAFFKDTRVHKTFGLFLCLFSIFLLISFISYFFTWENDESFLSGSFYNFFTTNEPVSNWMGRFGALLSDIFIKRWFGVASFIFLLLFFITGFKLFLKINLLPLGKTFRHALFWILWLSTTLGFVLYGRTISYLGGVFGSQTSSLLMELMGRFGLGLLLFFSLAVFSFFSYNLNFLKNISFKGKESDNAGDEDEENEEENESEEEMLSTNKNVFKEKKIQENVDTNENKTIEFQIDTIEPVEEEEEKVEEAEEVVLLDDSDIEFTVEEAVNKQAVLPEDEEDAMLHIPVSEPYDPTLELSDFKFPDIELLNDYSNATATVKNEELTLNKNKIVDTLKNYAISIVKIVATIGPTVTLYEIIPAPGVRISRIKNLEDDIALSLSALGIRIIAPIPGKGTIGIEVPNQNPEIVSMKSIIASDRFQNNKFELPIGLGKTISNESFVSDLTKMPHLLMAGATGQGKSVGLNAVITSLLYHKHPAQVKFILVDPKKVELSLFSKIERHYLAKLPDTEEAIITDTRKVVCTLNSLCIEMDQRYDLLKEAQVRNIKEYNAKFIARKLNPEKGHKYLPYIVLIVDEFADLIMTAGKEIEAPIARLAQLARAIGIHLIIATQRPSVNIITGTIKANFPARLAFRVTSKIDSRTILDSGGADQLIGRGDMLLSTGNEVIRLQCAFIDIDEVEKITDFIGSQRGYADAFHLPEYVDEQSDNGASLDTGDKDPMFEEAARLIVAHQQGSTSLIQRKMKLGYNRAGRIIDQLEAAGIVGPFEGSKAREVKIKDPVALEQYLNDLNNKTI